MIEAIQAGLTASAIIIFAVMSVVLFALAASPVVAELWRKWRGKDIVGKCASILAVAVAVAYGGSKMTNVGADEGIDLAAVWVEYDATNDVSAVEVRFTAGNVTPTTPVSVRNSETEQWRELEKTDAAVTSDLPTNVLAFAVSGNAATNRYWWVGTETPAVIIETTGITITHFAASSSSVQIMWTCDDPRATEFAVQRRRKRTLQWETVGVTSSLAFVYVGFTVGETWEWRVSATYTEGD